MNDNQEADRLHREGATLYGAGDLAGSMEKLGAAVVLDGSRADLAADLGVVCQAAGDLAGAEQHLARAVEIEPENAGIAYNFARVLVALERPEEAEALYRKVIKLDSNHAAAHNNLGNIMKAKCRHAEAEACYRAAIAADKSFAPARRNLADSLELSGAYEEARAAYNAAIHVRADSGARIRDALLLPVIINSADQMAEVRLRMEQKLDVLLNESLTLTDPLAEVGGTNFLSAYHGLDDRGIQEKIARIYERACPGLLYRAPHVDHWMAGLEGGPMRIGFVSVFFHDHSIGRLNLRLIEGLARPDFEVHVFSFSKVQDEMAARIEAGADRFHRLPADLDAVRAAIADTELDCLYFTDIGMEPISYFLAFSRLAPIQCATWGHPVTSGIANVDYFISSRPAETADADSAYSETLVRLDDFSHTIPNPVEAKDFGKGGGVSVLACPQSLFKFHPDFDPILEGILAANPGTRLDIVCGSRDNWTRLLKARLQRTVPAGAGRIRFVGRMGGEDYFRFLAGAAAVLDTPHFSGGVTSYEALAAGTPVVTLPGEFSRGRLTLGLYRQMGYEDCIARDGDDYVGLVSKLLGDNDFAEHARRQISKGVVRIFDPAPGVRGHAGFFARAMFEHEET